MQYGKNRGVVVALLILNSFIYAESPKPIQLDPPDKTGGRPLMRTLKDRRSTKAFAERSIPMHIVSDLLWAAFGINRPDSGKRTAPSAFNCQEIDIYVVFKQAAYRYEAATHRLLPACDKDIRKLAASQDYARVAPLQLVYIADRAKISRGSDDKKAIYSAFHAGAIAQNVHLYCASAGLGSVVRDGVNRVELRKALELRVDQSIVIGQSVGYPKKP